MRIRRQVLALCLAAIAALAVAACGSSDSSSTSTGDSTAGSSTTPAASTNANGVPGNAAGMDRVVGGEATTSALAAGKKAAANFGAPVPAPTGKTLGLVNVLGASEAAQRIQKGAEDAVESMGWTIKSVDTQGDPKKSQEGIQGYVTQKVDAILDLSNSTQAITQGLAAARAANIPVLNIGGVQDPSPNIESQFAVDETEFTKVLNAYMLGKIPNDAKMMTITFPLLLSLRLRDQQLARDLKGTDIKVVSKHTLDFTDPVADTQKAVNAALAANPDLNVIWGDTDVSMPPTGQVLKQKSLCDKVQNYNYYDDQANLDQIRKGCATAVVTSPVDSDGWAAVDALAELWARNDGDLSTLPKGWPEVTPKYGVEIRNGDAIEMVDKTNVPQKAGEYMPPKTDFVAFFKQKWATEFGVK